ncbi:hypothetical protein HK101_004988 [Irineochytrium annulatum]|nr:hypothetical protein HK101_004988 [Irineochytrium annulatum]
MTSPISTVSPLTTQCLALHAFHPPIPPVSCCGWSNATAPLQYVTCDNTNTTVIELVLENAMPVPGVRLDALDFNALPGLKVLQMNMNGLTGGVPGSLGACVGLTRIELSTNNLTGELPPLSKLTDLQFLFAYQNEFTGMVPALSTLTQLREINLSSNNLTGPLPDPTPLTNLSIYYFFNNNFRGGLPSFANSPYLAGINVGNNSLSGPIPPSLSALTDLRYLQLQNNYFTGQAPDVSSMTSLFSKNINNNCFAPTPNISFTNRPDCPPAFLPPVTSTVASFPGIPTSSSTETSASAPVLSPTAIGMIALGSLSLLVLGMVLCAWGVGIRRRRMKREQLAAEAFALRSIPVIRGSEAGRIESQPEKVEGFLRSVGMAGQ